MSKSNSLQIETVRHSMAHLMATAILKLWPQAKFGVGPIIENGFYYDIQIPNYTLKESDLKKIEKEMHKLIQADLEFKRQELKIDAAIKLFQKIKQPYKIELLRDIKTKGTTKIDSDEVEVKKNGTVSLYTTGDFIDLCRGPHISSTKELAKFSFKLQRLAGAYWRGDEHNPMLTRIYGVAFNKKEELADYLKKLAYAEKYNHRKIGKEMELFMVSPAVGQGLPIWLPNGFIIRRILEDYMIRFERAYSYQHIITPHINKQELFERSGHLSHYKDSMYPPITIDDETYYLKPMNCPAGMMVYKMKPRSYKELPLKIGELGTVYRYEKSGELQGLQRVRGFTQNDAHIYCTPEQLEAQFMEVVEMLEKFYQDLGFTNYTYRLSLSDKNNNKYVGSRQQWQQAEATLKKVLTEHKIKFTEAVGEAAFYGPKLDVQAVNIFGKEDTISTVQFDFNLPDRFDLTYVGADGDSHHRPFVIHRALIGSFERFFAFLIEYYAGKFPLWLAPVQVKVIAVSQKHIQACNQLVSKFKQQNIRVVADISDETVGHKIRQAIQEKVPYMLVIGDQEIQSNKLHIRQRDVKEIIQMPQDKFFNHLQKLINSKSTQL